MKKNDELHDDWTHKDTQPPVGEALKEEFPSSIFYVPTLLVCQYVIIRLHKWKQHPNGPPLQPPQLAHG